MGPQVGGFSLVLGGFRPLFSIWGLLLGLIGWWWLLLYHSAIHLGPFYVYQHAFTPHSFIIGLQSHVVTNFTVYILHIYIHIWIFFLFFSVMHKKWLWLASGQMEKKWWFLYSCGVSGGQPLPHLCACIPPHRILSPLVKASAMVPGLYWLHGTSLPRVQVSCSAQNSSLLLLAVQNYGGTAQE